MNSLDTSRISPAGGDERGASYQRDGYVIARGIFDQHLMSRARAHLLNLATRFPELRPDEISSHVLQNDVFWYALISHPDIVDLAAAFIGPGVAHFYSRYFAKQPFDGREVPWHQDAVYYPLDPVEFCTIWIALDDADASNGCLRVIPGSHAGDLQPIEPTANTESILKRLMDQSLANEGDARELVVQAGDCIVIHPRIIHGSRANTSARWRRGLAVRYIPTNVRILWEELYGEPWDCAFLLRGQAHHPGNNYLPAPVSSATMACNPTNMNGAARPKS